MPEQPHHQSPADYWDTFWPTAGEDTGGIPGVSRVRWTQYPEHGPGAEFLGAPKTALEIGSASCVAGVALARTGVEVTKCLPDPPPPGASGDQGDRGSVQRGGTLRVATVDHPIDQVRKEQSDAADRVRDQSALTVSSFVLDCTLPGEESDWRKASRAQD